MFEISSEWTHYRNAGENSNIQIQEIADSCWFWMTVSLGCADQSERNTATEDLNLFHFFYEITKVLEALSTQKSEF